MELQKYSDYQNVDFKPEFTINLLGPPSIYKESERIYLKRHKSIGLLAYLADTGRKATRTDLSEIFWPDSSHANALGALRTTLTDIKTNLGFQILSIENDLISLPDKRSHCDVNRFRTEIKESTEPKFMKKTAELWDGGFLKGFDLPGCTQFADWQFLEEQNLQREYRTLLKKLSAKLAAENFLEEALIYLRKSLTLDSFDEESHREIMRLYDSLGDKTAALRQYKICVDILEDELGFPPEEATMVLAEQIQTNRKIRMEGYKQQQHIRYRDRIPRIAVLPFILLGESEKIDPDPGSIIAETMTDFFVTESNLEVISRTSTLAYTKTSKNLPRIAAELRADYIIEGFIEITKTYLIIENRLIDAAKDSVIFINRKKINELPDNFTHIGLEAAMDILKKMDLPDGQPLPEKKSKKRSEDIQISKFEEDPGKPWRLYAKHLLRDYDIQNLNLAMKTYNKAIELNPLDADAWAGVGATLSFQGSSGMFGADIKAIHEQADTAITKSLSINPDQPTALMIKAEILSEREWDYETAEGYIKRAMNISSNDSDILTMYSSLLIPMCRFDESLIMAERACELDPVNSWTLSAKYWSLIALKKYRKAYFINDQIDAIFPHPVQGIFSRAFIQLLLGNNEKFITAVEEIKAAIIKEGMSTILGLLAYAYATVGRIWESEKLINDLCRNRDSFIGFHMPIASTYVALGKLNIAMDWLEMAADNRDPGLIKLTFLPFYKPLYQLPRYQKLLKRVHFKPMV